MRKGTVFAPLWRVEPWGTSSLAGRQGLAQQGGPEVETQVGLRVARPHLLALAGLSHVGQGLGAHRSPLGNASLNFLVFTATPHGSCGVGEEASSCKDVEGTLSSGLTNAALLRPLGHAELTCPQTRDAAVRPLRNSQSIQEMGLSPGAAATEPAGPRRGG